MKYVASCSFGKDSIATILLAREHNEPLDEIVYCEVMFDENISAELPEHREFIYNKAIPLFENWGYKVTVLHSDKTYSDCFYHRTIRGKNIGKKKGFVMTGHCDVQRDCKLKPIRDYWKHQKKDVVQYIGIAIDEPKRLNRIANTENNVSLLEKYGYTEEMAKHKCIEYGLLSPIYSFTNRGGCWFCPNARDMELKHLRKNHPQLWNKLLEMEKEPDLIGHTWNILTGTSIRDKEERFFWEEQQMNIFDFIENK